MVTRCSPKKGLAILAAATATVAMAESRPVRAGCTRDSECKGTRICENARCVYPAPAAGIRGPSEAGTNEAATTAVGRAASSPPGTVPSAGAQAPASPPTPTTAAELESPAPAVTPPPSARLASRGPMHLTESQLADLRSAGASLDATDMEIAHRLGRRGLAGDDFVAAYREYRAMRSRYPELAAFGRDMVETIAVAQKLGLSEEDKYRFVWDRHERDRELMQTCREPSPRGSSLATLGGVTTGVSIVLLVVGRALASDEVYKQGEGNVTSKWGYAGKTMEVVGPVGIVAGLSITILGLVRWSAPRATDTRELPAVGRSQSLRPSASDQPRATTRWAFSPSLGPHQAGLGLTAAF